jgi:hypothetical protein
MQVAVTGVLGRLGGCVVKELATHTARRVCSIPAHRRSTSPTCATSIHFFPRCAASRPRASLISHTAARRRLGWIPTTQWPP